MAAAKILVPDRERGSSRPQRATKTCAGLAARMPSKAATDTQMGIEEEVNRKQGQYSASRTPDARVRARFDSFDSAVDSGSRFLEISANYGLAQMELKLRFPCCKAEHTAL